MRKTKVTFNHERLQLSSEILRALAHPLRLKILEFIDKHESVHVQKIYNTLGLEQSITSQHLRVFLLSIIVHTKRNGKLIHYTIDYPTVERAEKAIDNFIESENESE